MLQVNRSAIRAAVVEVQKIGNAFKIGIVDTTPTPSEAALANLRTCGFNYIGDVEGTFKHYSSVSSLSE